MILIMEVVANMLKALGLLFLTIFIIGGSLLVYMIWSSYREEKRNDKDKKDTAIEDKSK